MKNTSNKSVGNMIVGECVACGGQIRIPLNGNPDTIVRCPRCGDDFTLQSVLEQVAPALEIVEVPEKILNSKRVVPIIDEGIIQPDDRQKGDKFVVSPILQNGAKRKKRRRRRSSESSESKSSDATNGKRPRRKEREMNGSRDGSPSNTSPSNTSPVPASTTPESFSPSVATEEVAEENKVETVATGMQENAGIREKIDASRKARTTTESRPKRKRRSKSESSAYKSSSDSGGLEWAKIVLGACLALPVAQLLIWHFAGTDPLNIGPTVSKFVPFVVPKEFQPEIQEKLDKEYPKSTERPESMLPEPDFDASSIRIDELTE